MALLALEAAFGLAWAEAVRSAVPDLLLAPDKDFERLAGPVAPEGAAKERLEDAACPPDALALETDRPLANSQV